MFTIFDAKPKDELDEFLRLVERAADVATLSMSGAIYSDPMAAYSATNVLYEYRAIAKDPVRMLRLINLLRERKGKRCDY